MPFFFFFLIFSFSSQWIWNNCFFETKNSNLFFLLTLDPINPFQFSNLNVDTYIKKKKNRFLSFIDYIYIKYAISIKLDLFSARDFYVYFTCCTSHSDKGDHLNACYWKLKTFNYYLEWVANARLLIVNFNDNSPLFYSHNIAKNWWNKRNKYRKIY